MEITNPKPPEQTIGTLTGLLEQACDVVATIDQNKAVSPSDADFQLIEQLRLFLRRQGVPPLFQRTRPKPKRKPAELLVVRR